jgi:hypothetical protein
LFIHFPHAFHIKISSETYEWVGEKKTDDKEELDAPWSFFIAIISLIFGNVLLSWNQPTTEPLRKDISGYCMTQVVNILQGHCLDTLQCRIAGGICPNFVMADIIKEMYGRDTAVCIS